MANIRRGNVRIGELANEFDFNNASKKLFDPVVLNYICCFKCKYWLAISISPRHSYPRTKDYLGQ